MTVVCRPGEPCEPITWREARALTLALTALPEWPGPTVLVGLCRIPGYLGTNAGRVIRYSELTTPCAVIHELAHVASHDPEHGERFHRWAGTLVTWVTRLSF